MPELCLLTGFMPIATDHRIFLFDGDIQFETFGIFLSSVKLHPQSVFEAKRGHLVLENGEITPKRHKAPVLVRPLDMGLMKAGSASWLQNHWKA